MADYRVYQNRLTGNWDVQYKQNEPIPHAYSAEAFETLRHLLYLESHYRVTRRGHRRRFDEP